MPLYRPSELRSFLGSIDKEPSRSLSQNFLIDGNIVHKIVDATQIGPESCVLEIGPGPGVLTEAMLAAGACVASVEKDTIFAQHLRRLCADEKRLRIIEADILDCSFREIYQQPFVLVSNLPYHLTTPILERVILNSTDIKRAVIMVQKEAAERIICQKKARISYLPVLCSLFFQIPLYFPVPRGCFWPKPHVDSVVIVLQRVASPLDHYLQDTVSVIRQAFSSKRKVLMTTLSSLFSKEQVEHAFSTLGFSPKIRAEELSKDQWEHLISFLKNVH
jgi:16S rRNA (adenine1518-N6/adenine1519-N6)-dimethyltransferase